MELQGTQGVDTLTGGADSDTIYGYGGNDTLKGGAGDDVLAGNDGNDILQGGDGDDYILGGAGNDTIDGGAGNDWAAYEDAAAGVKVDLNLTGTQNTVGAGTDKLTSIENVYGSAFNDTLTGNAEANMLVGGEGNDAVGGGKGDDTLWGSAGNDTLDGGDGDDYMVGGAGDDVIKGGAGWDWSSYEDATAGVTVDLNKTTAQNTGGGGTDTLTGVEHLYGTAFNDVLTGDAQDNYLWGDAGDDKLVGGAGDDHLSGGAGANIIDGGDGFDTVDYAFSDVGVDIDLSRSKATSRVGATITDTLTSVEAAMGSAHDDYLAGNSAENYLFGDAGNDILWAIGGHDTLDGGDGNDILYGSNLGEGDLMLGGAGDDTVIVCAGEAGKVAATADGGVGVDTLQFNTNLNITFDLKNTGDQLAGTNTHVIAQNFENLTGGEGNDRLTGDAGANTIEGREGADILDGGAGLDVASYASAASAVRVDLSKAGVAQDTRGAGTDTLNNFEGLKGSRYADILIGDAKDNTFEGGAGNDIIDGGAGSDTAIYKGASKDYGWIHNANGTWTVFGAEGVDTLLNIETLKFSDKSVTLSPSETTVKVDDLLGPQIIAKSSDGKFVDAALSSDGATLYLSDTDGYISAIETASGNVTGRWKVGSALTMGGIDLSADGRYVVAVEQMLTDVTESQFSRQGKILVHMLDVKTGQVKDYATTATGYDSGFRDAVFVGDKVLFSQRSDASGGRTPLTTLDLATGKFTRGTELFWTETMLSVSADHQHVLMGGASQMVDGIYTLKLDGDRAVLLNQIGNIAGSSKGIQAISGDGSLIAESIGGGVLIYDKDLRPIADLSGLAPALTSTYGLDFSADSKHLFVVDFLNDRILQISTSNWDVEKAFTLDIDIFPSSSGSDWYYGGFGNRVMVSDDNSRLTILARDSVVSVNLTTLQPDGGTYASDTLVGGAGVDHLNGFGGDDILSGGRGADILIGGKGGDVFLFADGDTSWPAQSDAGVDVIKDWDFSDKLFFGSTADPVVLGKQVAPSWSVALAMASEAIATQHISHLAVQVGYDVYVFHARAGTTTGAIDNVVKLESTITDNISAMNFAPNQGGLFAGDDGGNYMVGGIWNDTMDGGAGNDILQGGKGTDTMTGGTGADVFKFLAGEGSFSLQAGSQLFAKADVITDFGAGDKLAFSNGAVTASDILNLGHFDAVPAAYPVSAALELYLYAQVQQYEYGVYSQKYFVFGVGADTYVLADNDPTHYGYDQVVLLKNVSSSLVTADMFMAA
jgi:Ca2+-binding RTX toxin-like protein